MRQNPFEFDRVRETAAQAMTAKNLREALEDAPDDALVFFVCSYGDYHSTQQALPVSEVQADCYTDVLATSAYSRSGLALVGEDEDEYDEDEEGEDEESGDIQEDTPIVILRM